MPAGRFSLRDLFKARPFTDDPDPPRNPGAHGCLFCGEGHFTSDCLLFRDLGSRKMFFQENDMCHICGHQHAQEECYSTSRCYLCNRASRVVVMYSHHTSLCPFKTESTKRMEGVKVMVKEFEERQEQWRKSKKSKVAQYKYFADWHK